MKQRFFSLFAKRWKFQKSNLEESGAELKNPARGWYQVHTFSLGECCHADDFSLEEGCLTDGFSLEEGCLTDDFSLEEGCQADNFLVEEDCQADDFSTEEDCRADDFAVEKDSRTEELVWRCTGEDTLALLLVDIGAYKDRDLDEVTLAKVDKILGFFVDKGLDIILRFSYDHEGKALEREPFFFSRVTAHVDQLGPLLTKYAPHIFVYQGLLVGNWGEMHTSRFLDIEKLSQLTSLLNGYLGDEVYMAVRRPSYWRSLHPQFCGKESYQGIFMGLFDDGIFGSDTHLGTFGVSKEVEAGWESAWSPEEEIAFEEKLGNYAPQGGEALYEEQAAKDRTLAETVERLRRMRVSYLNRDHDVRLLEHWKKLIWTEEGPYLGMSGYDYIGRHMGYRFCVRNVTAKFFRGHEETCAFKIVIENVGFSRCYHETKVWLEWETGTAVHRQELDLDLSSILPGEKGIGSCTAQPAPGDVYVCAERKKDKVPIHFANEQEDTRRILLGSWRGLTSFDKLRHKNI